MKLVIGDLTYELIHYEDQYAITEYKPFRELRFFLRENCSQNDFSEIEAELIKTHNLIILYDEENKLIKEFKLTALLSYYYDFGNNALDFALNIEKENAHE